jgi:AraC-like DNA-binding protein
MEFWIFPLDSPELDRFYSEQERYVSLYCAIYIEKVTGDYSAETKKVLHLQDETILLIDNYLAPVFIRSRLKGYLIILTEAFFETAESIALLRLAFFHRQPEGIIDMGQVNEYQKKCISLVINEYYSPNDEMQALLIRNVLVNMIFLSSTVNYEGQLRAGHLLNYALQFTDLIGKYASREKKKIFYANNIGITGKVLDKSLRLIYQTTFKEILIGKVLIDAMRLLVFSDKSIALIAHELDYDPSNFNSLFFKRKEMYPKDLRVNYRKVVNEIESAY